MTPQEKRKYDEKTQAVLTDILTLIEKHGCFFTIDPVELCLRVSFHTDSALKEQLKQVVMNRWKASVVSSKQTPEYEILSPEMQQTADLQKKMEALNAILDPMEIVAIMTRLASGEKPIDVLAEYDDRIQEHKAQIKSIDDDPTKLLADFNSSDDESLDDM